MREDASQKNVDDETGAKKGMRLSKDVANMRNYESFFLEAYKKFLMTIEFFQKMKPGNLIKKMGVKDEEKRKHLLGVYTKLRDTSVSSFCKILRRHTHFNFRLNILQTIMPRIASHELDNRREVTNLLFELLKSTD